MNPPLARILVSVSDQFACLKIIGRANFASSIDFRTAATELYQKNANSLVLELSECTLMDSTFLGVLAGLGVKMGGSPADPGEHPIILLNPNPRVLELLETLGVLHLFKLVQATPPLPALPEAAPIRPSSPDLVQIAHVCLDAHRILMEINPANIAKFKDLAAFLAEDLKKLKADP